MAFGSSICPHEQHKTALCRAFARLAFSVKEASFMTQMFEDIDRELTGYISADALLSYYQLDDVPGFAKECLCATKTIRKAELTYQEMLICLYNFLTLSKPRLIDYAFEMLDDLGAGEVERDTVTALVPDLHTSMAEVDRESVDELHRKVKAVRFPRRDGLHCNHSILIDQLDSAQMVSTTRSGMVTLQDWRRIAKRNATLLTPLHEAQRRLQEACMGPRCWAEMLQDRLRSFIDSDHPSAVILELLSSTAKEGDGDISAAVLRRLQGLPDDDATEEVFDPNEGDFETPRLQSRFDDSYKAQLEKILAVSLEETIEPPRLSSFHQMGLTSASMNWQEKRRRDRRKRNGVKKGLQTMRTASSLLKAESVRSVASLTRVLPRMQSRVTGDLDDGEKDHDDQDFLETGELEPSDPVYRRGSWWCEETSEGVDENDSTLLGVSTETADAICQYNSLKQDGTRLLRIIHPVK
jgi:Ca2+-binding EF-hand superfamily protein